MSTCDGVGVKCKVQTSATPAALHFVFQKAKQEEFKEFFSVCL